MQFQEWEMQSMWNVISSHENEVIIEYGADNTLSLPWKRLKKWIKLGIKTKEKFDRKWQLK